MSKKSKIIIASLLILSPIIMMLNLYFSIPNQITLAAGSNYSYNLQPFLTLNSPADKFIKTSTNLDSIVKTVDNKTNIGAENTGNYTLSVKLFNKIPLKNVDVVITPKRYVVPSGSPVGVKLYTDGVLVVGVSYVTSQNGENVFPAKQAGIKVGDRIIAVNGFKVLSTQEMTEKIQESRNGILTLSIERDDVVTDITVNAVKNKNDKHYKLGIWVRDTAAGVGTMTFYDVENKKFASLGHAITDVDTGDVLKLSKGSILSCNILSITKGERGKPGELVGSFGDYTIGNIELNSNMGIYGSLENVDNLKESPKIEVATKFQIKEGKAFILADLDGSGVKEYDIEIQKISKDNIKNNKGIVFKVINQELLDKTGGIVQGMSGCPIIQDDMLIGAVTHVFVNDPTKGYGIFAENMIDNVNSLIIN